MLIVGIFAIAKYGTNDSTTNKNYEVVVVGGTTSGVSAAIEAARGGAKVLLVESTDWLGGQMTSSGVSTIDEGHVLKDDTGIWAEFIEGVKVYYKDKPINTCYWTLTSRCFEPKVGNEVLKKMVANEPNLKVQYLSTINRVWKNGDKITGVQISNNEDGKKIIENVKTLIVIDASDTGYVIPLSGADYRIGKYTNSTDNKDEDTCIQSITYPLVAKKYTDGVPEDLKFKAGEPPGGEVSYNLIKKTFATELTANGNSWKSSTGSTVRPFNWAFASGFRALPDSLNLVDYQVEKDARADGTNYTTDITKTALNLSNDYKVTIDFLINSTTYSKNVCAAKLRTMQYLYYIQQDLGQSDWSISNDEGYQDSKYGNTNLCPELKDYRAFEKYFPLTPYIRESIRLIGDYTLTGKYLKILIIPYQSQRSFSSTVAVGDYFTDMHGCKASTDLESDLENSTYYSDVPRAFEIPMGSFVTSKVKGLIAAEKNISQSRIANGATRLQPSTMAIGQAAGAIASLSIKGHISPNEVDSRLVQQKLLKEGQRINKISLTGFVDADNEIAVKFAFANNLIDSVTTYTNNISRIDFARIYAKFFNLETTTSRVYSDVLSKDSAYANIAVDKLGMSACGNGRFCPDTLLSRHDYYIAISMILNVSDLNFGSDVSDLDKSDPLYSKLRNLMEIGIDFYCDGSAKKICAENPMQLVKVFRDIWLITEQGLYEKNI